jgi:CubicO group peptidase (beta-lactamase class C family)
LQEYVRNGHRIKCVAFPEKGGNSWSIITNHTFSNRNIPDECHQKMRQLQDDGHNIRCVAFPPSGNGFSIITDQDFFNRNIPEICDNAMRKMQDEGHLVTWVAFPPSGNPVPGLAPFSIITDKDFFNFQVPEDCDQRMKTLKADGEKIVSVSFPPKGGDRWTIVTERGFVNRNVSSVAHRVMRAFHSSGLGPLECVAYHPEKGFVVVGKSSALRRSHPTLEIDDKRFSLTAFLEELQGQLETSNSVKYGVFLRYKDAIRTVVSGPKRTAVTPPAQDFTVFDWFNPASVTKTLSSVALLRLLQEKQLSVNELIANHLPDSWDLGENVNTITVAELLNHTSGFRGGSTSHSELRDMVEAGVKLSDKVDSYCNCNTALARVVLANMVGFDDHPLDPDEVTAKTFIDYVQDRIFDPIGAPDVQWKPDQTAPTLFYPLMNPTSTGTSYGDWSLRPGSAGSHVSLAELAAFLRVLNDTDQYLGNQMKAVMNERQLGWAKTDLGTLGHSYRKRGFFPASSNGGAELNSGIWQFSTGVQAVIVRNGSGGVDMTSAYSGAWD